MKRLIVSWNQFFFAPASATPLAILRISLSLILIFQGMLIAPNLLDLYGRSGILQGALSDYLLTPFGFTLSSLNWLPNQIFGFSFRHDDILILVFYAYMSALVFLLIGFRTKLAALVATIAHWMFLGAGFWSSYGADRFSQIALFYFIWMPIAEEMSFDSRNTFETKPPAHPLARPSLRILQLHLCIVYLSTAIAKSRGHAWWNGDAVWLALMSYGTESARLLALRLSTHPWLFRMLDWGAFAIEYGYALFIWPRFTRRWMLIFICSLHVGIALSMGLVSFSAIMIALSVSAFGVSSVPEVHRRAPRQMPAPRLHLLPETK